MRKIYILPNLVTTANMFCGFSSIVNAIHGKFEQAAWLILAAMAFDMMDGRIARLTRATSAFGVQYDSLSDLLSFGITPAVLMYMWALEPFGRLGIVVPFFYIVCAALRLARFNIRVDSAPKDFFQGLPSPLAAVTVAGVYLFYVELQLNFLKEYAVFPLMVIVGLLMVSNVLFYSFKNLKLKKEAQSFAALLILISGFVFLTIRPEVNLFILCIAYIAVGLVASLWRMLRPRKQESPVASP